MRKVLMVKMKANQTLALLGMHTSTFQITGVKQKNLEQLIFPQSSVHRKVMHWARSTQRPAASSRQKWTTRTQKITWFPCYMSNLVAITQTGFRTSCTINSSFNLSHIIPNLQTWSPPFQSTHCPFLRAPSLPTWHWRTVKVIYLLKMFCATAATTLQRKKNNL